MIFLDRFDTVSHLRGKARTYEAIKEAVLEAGRFSAFDVITQKDCKIFTALCKDPTLEVVNVEYPWTSVKEKK